jgi:hypothetical protein
LDDEALGGFSHIPSVVLPSIETEYSVSLMLPSRFLAYFVTGLAFTALASDTWGSKDTGNAAKGLYMNRGTP